MKEYKLDKFQFLSKELFWYGLISWYQEDLNPSHWTIWDNFFMIVLFIIFQLYILGSCSTEIKKNEDGN